MRALVFGGARYLGSHVVAALRQHGHDASAIDFPDPLNFDEDPEFEPRVTGQIIPGTVDGARTSALDFGPADFDATIFCGVDGYCAAADPAVTDDDLAAERAMLERLLSERPQAFVLCSSTVVYSASDSPILDEASPALAGSRMAVHCRGLEEMVLSAAERHDIPISILRCSIVSGVKPGTNYYGRAAKLGYLLPGLRVTDTAYPLVMATLDAGAQGFPDHNVMDFVHAGDAAAALVLAASSLVQRPGARDLFNVGSETSMPVAESLTVAAGYENLRLEVATEPSALPLPCSAVSRKAIGAELGWKPTLPSGLIPTNEVLHFCNKVLSEKNIGPTARVSNELLANYVTKSHLIIYGLLFVLDRAGGFSNDNITLEVNGKRYRPNILTRRGIGLPFKQVRVSPYRLQIPLVDVREFPIQNPIRIVYVTPDGYWFRRRMRYSLLRPRPRHAHRKLHRIAQSDSTLYLRQAGDNFVYITLRARIRTDSLAMSPKIRAARLASLVRREPVVLLYEKESSRYEESGSVLFEAMVDRGRTDVRYILDADRLVEVPEKYRPFVVPRFSFTHLYYFFCARTFLGTEAVAHAAELRTAHRAFLKKLFSNDYHYVFLQHGVMYMVALSSSQRAPFRAGGSIFPPGTRIVVSSELEARHFIELGGFQRSDMYVSGLPKFDRAEHNPDPDLILIMPTWRPWEHNTIRANPLQAPYYKMVVELFDAVPENLKHKTAILPHPLLASVLAETDLKDHLWSGGSYEDALRQGALLITDYSSIAYDAFYRGANVIFWWKEKDFCMQQYGGHLMLEEDTAFGPVCSDAATLSDLVSASYQAPQDTEYVKRYREIVQFHDGKNTERLLKLIEDDDLLKP